MSSHALAWAWKQPVAPGPKLVLVKLADQANDDGECWPSNKTIGKETGMGESTVRRHVGTLEGAGLLRREPREREKSKGQTSNLYVLTPAQIERGGAPKSSGEPRSVAGPLESPQGKERSPDVERAPDLIWDTLVELLGAPPRTKGERGKWNKAAKELREADVTPDEIRTAVAAYGRHPTFKDCALTPLAIVTNLSALLTWAKPAQASRADDIRRRMAERGIA